MLSKVAGMDDEYIRLGHAIKKYGYIQRRGMSLVQNRLDFEKSSLGSSQGKTKMPEKYLFYGPKGIGKRTSIAACLNSCYTQQLNMSENGTGVSTSCVFLVIPSAMDLIYTQKPGMAKDGRGFGFNNAEVVTWRSPFRNSKNGGIDHPRFSNYVLNHFLNQNNHSNVLNKLKTKYHIQFTETISVKPGTSFKTLAEFGLKNDGLHGTEAFSHLIKELLDPESSQERPPLIIAVNSVHCLYARKTNIYYWDIPGEKVDDYDQLRNVDDLNIVKTARNLVEGDWTNGAILLSTRQEDQIKGYTKTSMGGFSKRHRTPGRPGFGKKVNNLEENTIQEIHSDMPVDLIGDGPFRRFDPHIPIFEGDMTPQEINTLINYYESIGYLNFNTLTKGQLKEDYHRALDEFKIITDRNPGEIFKQAAYY